MTPEETLVAFVKLYQVEAELDVVHGDAGLEFTYIKVTSDPGRRFLPATYGGLDVWVAPQLVTL